MAGHALLQQPRHLRPAQALERTETIVPELAERWSWQDNYRNLVFFLRKDVKWHDGQPFTSKDVKFTFDVVREAKDAPAKLRLNPRKEWYTQRRGGRGARPLHRGLPAQAAAAVAAHHARLRLLAGDPRPRAARRAPRRAASAPGPFKFKEWKRGESVELVKNPDYFVKGRPYLDGLRYVIIVERGTRVAALQAGQVDVAYPGDTTVAIAEQPQGRGAADGLHGDRDQRQREPPAQHEAAAASTTSRCAAPSASPSTGAPTCRPCTGAAPSSAPPWRPSRGASGGSSTRTSPQLPGYGKGAEDKARARKLLAEAGFGPSNPLKVEMATRAIAIYLDFAAFVVSELKQVGVEATLKQIDTAQWHPMATRREFQIGANLTGLGVDDPDANFYENYACGSPRNYGDYCNEQVMRLIDQQSQEIDPQKRLALVWQIQKKLEEDAARPIMGWRVDRFAHYPT